MLFRSFVAFLLAVSFAPLSAQALVWQKGNNAGVRANEVINDDLYIFGNKVSIDGVVNGDLIVFGQDVTINGTVGGNVAGAAQSITVNGKVAGSLRVAGSALLLGEKATVGKDLVGAAYSLELRPGSSIARDLAYAGKQLLLAGSVTRNAVVAGDGVEIAGQVGGNVTAKVHDKGKGTYTPHPSMFMQSSIPIPQVATGLLIDPTAHINGTLHYTQSHDLPFPANVIAGAITRLPQKIEMGARGPSWPLQSGRLLATLLILGFFMSWLFPSASGRAASAILAKPLHALLMGLVAFAAFVGAEFVLLLITIFAAALFAALSLPALCAIVLGLGFLSMLGGIVVFVIVLSFVTKVLFGIALGRLILSKSSPSLAEHRYWPMLVGVVITWFAIALLSAPMLPGVISGLLKLVITLFGLGALWTLGSGNLKKS